MPLGADTATSSPIALSSGTGIATTSVASKAALMNEAKRTIVENKDCLNREGVVVGRLDVS
jgi:hypothetical protein